MWLFLSVFVLGLLLPLPILLRVTSSIVLSLSHQGHVDDSQASISCTASFSAAGCMCLCSPAPQIQHALPKTHLSALDCVTFHPDAQSKTLGDRRVSLAFVPLTSSHQDLLVLPLAHTQAWLLPSISTMLRRHSLSALLIWISESLLSDLPAVSLTSLIQTRLCC